MRTILRPVVLMIISFPVQAQNAGIGTNAPKTTFEVRGNLSTPSVPSNTASAAVFRLSGSANGGIDFGIHTVPWLQAGFDGIPSNMSIQPLGGNIGIGTTSANASAKLEINSTTQGFLPPRMTTAQKNAISNPQEGLEVYDLDLHQKFYYNGSTWVSMVIPDALPTIQIGKQKWMNKNLDVAFYRNGDPIPQVTDPTAWANLTTGAWCFYNNDSTLGNKYGKLYNWYAVNDPRGLAPQGWHIPGDAEWTVLSNNLGGDGAAGGTLKEAGTQNWTSPNTGGNNNSGFTGLPGGNRGTNGAFSGIGADCHWWSATEGSTTNSWMRYLYYGFAILYRYNLTKTYGFSVRCVRD